MKLITSSSMGKNYDHVRLIAEVTAEPSEEASAKLMAINNDDVEIDLIQSGWGEAEGYSIGGKNVRQELQLTGEFTEVGNYGIHIKLIDRDDSDTVIVEKTFNLAVAEKQIEDNGNNNDNNNNDNKDNALDNNKEENNNQGENLPATLPKTGTTEYTFIFTAIGILSIAYAMTFKKNMKH